MREVRTGGVFDAGRPHNLALISGQRARCKRRECGGESGGAQDAGYGEGCMQFRRCCRPGPPVHI